MCRKMKSGAVIFTASFITILLTGCNPPSVINNPDWEGICWVLRAIVKTEGDVYGTKVYIPAPLPTKTPILGCLVQSPTRGGDPVCVVPCPIDAVPGDPCTP